MMTQHYPLQTSGGARVADGSKEGDRGLLKPLRWALPFVYADISPNR